MSENSQTRPNVRRAGHADAAALVDFNRRMAFETEARELALDKIRPGVARVLDEPERGFYLVAEPAGAPGTVGGSLMVTFEWSDWRNGNFWWVQSVYVRPEYRRQGLYRALYDVVRREARAAGDVCGVRLYVERDNEVAQRVYAELGMHCTPYQLFEEEFTA